MSVKTQFSKLIFKCLNVGTIKAYANGFISSSEALKNVILVIFAHVAPEVLTFRGVKQERQQICL